MMMETGLTFDLKQSATKGNVRAIAALAAWHHAALALFYHFQHCAQHLQRCDLQNCAHPLASRTFQPRFIEPLEPFAPGFLRAVLIRNKKNVKQNAYRCISPGGNPGGRHAGRPCRRI